MSETALTLIKSALRVAGAIGVGMTPTADEAADGLEAMKFMLRNWSAQNIRLYYTKQETLTMTGAASYTIGSGGNLDTVRPASIRGAWTSDGPVTIIDEDRYRQVRHLSLSGLPVEYLWYSSEYPLGKAYPWPLASGSLYLDSLKPLTDPVAITTDVEFPPEYDDAIKWNLAVRLGPEYGREASPTVQGLAAATLHALETRNFAQQVNSIRPELLKLANAKYNIDNE